MLTGNEALLIFRELGHRTTEGTVAFRLAAVARGLGRPRAARRYAELAVAAGEQSSTRTTIALGHVNLARLDLDDGDPATAADHLARALELIDPGADRWVLVEALEAVARLLVATARPGSGQLLGDGGRDPARDSPARSPRRRQPTGNGRRSMDGRSIADRPARLPRSIGRPGWPGRSSMRPRHISWPELHVREVARPRRRPAAHDAGARLTRAKL